jgi:hypothetical protein
MFCWMEITALKTSTKNRKDLGEVGVQAKYIFTRIAKAKALLHQSPIF